MEAIENRTALILWCRYECDCEAYDQTVCKARDHDGTAIPVEPHEKEIITRHAGERYRELQAQAADLGVTAEALQAAKLAAQPFTPKRVEELAALPLPAEVEAAIARGREERQKVERAGGFRRFR